MSGQVLCHFSDTMSLDGEFCVLTYGRHSVRQLGQHREQY